MELLELLKLLAQQDANATTEAKVAAQQKATQAMASAIDAHNGALRVLGKHLQEVDAEIAHLHVVILILAALLLAAIAALLLQTYAHHRRLKNLEKLLTTQREAVIPVR